MTDITPKSDITPKYWRDGAFASDGWHHGESDDGSGQVILPLAAYLALSLEQRKAGANRLGVMILPGEKLDEIVPDLAHVSLIALTFPAYNDGRSHSKAALLRSRYGYAGEIRAVGDVLVDQIPLLLRNGFNSLEIKSGVAIKRLEDHIDTSVPIYYQPATTAATKPAGYSWRRVPANS